MGVQAPPPPPTAEGGYPPSLSGAGAEGFEGMFVITDPALGGSVLSDVVPCDDVASCRYGSSSSVSQPVSRSIAGRISAAAFSAPSAFS